ncbi:MAG: SulP family inorganic anion transporter [Ilumatobacteraceae bacterium]
MEIARPSTGDLIAGISVALIAIPQSLAYAELAGVPAQIGLFASALPPLCAALFVSSKYLQTGPVALTALLTFGALSTIAEPGSPEYVRLAALLALMVGVMRVVLGLVRLGALAYLLSEPVLLGFTTGAAITIVASQIPKVFDVAPAGDGVLLDALEVLVNPGDWSPAAMGFAALALVCMFGGRRIHPLVPGVLLAVVLGVVLSEIVDYGGTKVGELDGAFVSLGFDFEWSSTGDLLLPALAIALVGFAEPSSIARTFAAEERLPWNSNREMVSQGVANLASGFSGAFPVGGSFSRSSMNRMAGATSAWAGAITGAFVLVTLPLTPLLEPLPSAILGAIVVGAVIQLIRVGAIYRLTRLAPAQGMVAAGTLVATLLTNPRIERGVLIGIGLAFTVHLYREMNVTIVSDRDGDTLTIAPRGVLWFASVSRVERQLREELAEHQDIDAVVVDLAGVGRLDYSGGAALGRILSEFEQSGVTVRIANVRPGSARAARIFLSDQDED